MEELVIVEVLLIFLLFFVMCCKICFIIFLEWVLGSLGVFWMILGVVNGLILVWIKINKLWVGYD